MALKQAKSVNPEWVRLKASMVAFKFSHCGKGRVAEPGQRNVGCKLTTLRLEAGHDQGPVDFLEETLERLFGASADPDDARSAITETIAMMAGTNAFFSPALRR